MAYSSRQDLPRSYVPTPGIVTGASGLVVGGSPEVPSGGGMYPRVARPVGSVPFATPAPNSSLPSARPLMHPSHDIPIRVLLKQHLLISPMAIGPLPQIPPPRPGASFDFDFERDFIAQHEREAAEAAPASTSCDGASGAAALGGGRAGPSGAAAGQGSLASMPDPLVSELQQQLQRNGVSEKAAAQEAFLTACLPGPNAAVNGGRGTESVILDPAAEEFVAMGYPSDVVHLALAVHQGTTQSKVIDFCSAYLQLSEMGFAPEAIAGALALYDNDRDRVLAHLAPGL